MYELYVRHKKRVWMLISLDWFVCDYYYSSYSSFLLLPPAAAATSDLHLRIYIPQIICTGLFCFEPFRTGPPRRSPLRRPSPRRSRSRDGREGRSPGRGDDGRGALDRKRLVIVGPWMSMTTWNRRPFDSLSESIQSNHFRHGE